MRHSEISQINDAAGADRADHELADFSHAVMFYTRQAEYQRHLLDHEKALACRQKAQHFLSEAIRLEALLMAWQAQRQAVPA